jgi:CheY-like chemotaxis protein
MEVAMSDKTILIVDADSASLNFLVRLVKEQGYFAMAANAGKDALIIAWRDRPDMIIFDPVLQDISPEEFLLKLRRDLRSSDIPILALSSSHNPIVKEVCLKAGCNDYMLKSGEIVGTLPEKIVSLIGKKQELVKEGGFLIVFLSAKGGTGTSSLCANLAMTIHHSKPESRVAVVDMVLPIGSIAPIVGYQGDLNLVSVTECHSLKQRGVFHKPAR